jgi:hypothetical protein
MIPLIFDRWQAQYEFCAAIFLFLPQVPMLGRQKIIESLEVKLASKHFWFHVRMLG